MITQIPKMLTANKRKLTETFDFVHNVMSIPHHVIVRFPQVTAGCESILALRLPLLQHHASRSENALLCVKELGQMQSGSESCVKAIFLLPIFLSK